MGILKRVREELLVEARHRCTICAAMCFQVHHIIEKSVGGSDDADNLIVLCPNCHLHRVHRNNEITVSQLRLYKQRLGEGNEVERRLLLHILELQRQVARLRTSRNETHPVFDAILDDMLGAEDPIEVFQLTVPGWAPSRLINNYSLVAEPYARVYKLRGREQFVSMILERVSEDVDTLTDSQLRAVVAGHRGLFSDQEIIDCLGPFDSAQEAVAEANRWAAQER